MKNKHEMREAAIKRLRGVISNQSFVMTLCADDITKPLVGDGWSDSTVEEDAKTIIDLLTDDEPQYEGDAFAKGPRDAGGILWFRGDMSDSEWGVIERTYFDGEQWMVCGHDLTAPWIPADSIRHAPMRTATQREDDFVELLRDAARDYEGLQADCRGMSDLKDTCWQKFKDLHEAVDERYIELPKDANGEVIHLWDKITYHGASSWYRDIVFEVRGYGATAGRSIDSVVVRRDSHLETLIACCCKHYHKPTVVEILDELEGMRGTGDYEDVIKRCAELGRTLRELLKEDGNED